MNLLKLFTVAGLFLFVGFPLNAQFSLGIKGGYTKAWQDYGDTEVPENAIIHVNRMNVSAMAYYRLGKHLELGVEPGFVERGAACIPGFGLFFVGDTKYLLNYVELPLMLQASWGNKFVFFSKIGYGGSYVLSGTRVVTDLIFTDNPPKRDAIDFDDPSYNLNRWDHGIYGGIGVAYNFDIHRLFFSLEYYHGLKDVEKLNASQARSINFNLGYAIRF